MKAVVIEEPNKVAVKAIEDPAPGPTEAIVKVEACGICGTDIHVLRGEFAPTRYPIVPGHEFCGEVVAVGSDVRNVKDGDFVAVDPSLFCGHCRLCRAGRFNLCENWNAIGVGSVNGACAEFSGASTLHMVDTNPARHALAKRLAADRVAASADELDRPHGWDVVIDATGVVPAIEDGLRRVARGGTFLMFGVASADASARFSPFRVYNDEIKIIGSMAVLHSFERALTLLERGVVDCEAMITHRFSLDQYATAIDTFRQGTGLKVQVGPS